MKDSSEFCASILANGERTGTGGQFTNPEGKGEEMMPKKKIKKLERNVNFSFPVQNCVPLKITWIILPSSAWA